MTTGDVVVINGREYPAELYHVALAHEESGGAFRDAVRALRSLMEPERPHAAAAVREAIDAARALQPAPRNRHERRKVAALRRKGEML